MICGEPVTPFSKLGLIKSKLSCSGAPSSFSTSSSRLSPRLPIHSYLDHDQPIQVCVLFGMHRHPFLGKAFSTSTATSCAKSLPSFAAPSTSSAKSFAKSFTCVFHVSVVSPKGARVFGVGSELADGDGQDNNFLARPPPSTRVLGVSPMGSVGAACVCLACLKIWRGSVCSISI